MAEGGKEKESVSGCERGSGWRVVSEMTGLVTDGRAYEIDDGASRKGAEVLTTDARFFEKKKKSRVPGKYKTRRNRTDDFWRWYNA